MCAVVNAINNAINLEPQLLDAIASGSIERLKWLVRGIQCLRAAGVPALPNGEDNEVYMDAILILAKVGGAL